MHEVWKPVRIADQETKYRVPGVVSRRDVAALKAVWNGVADEGQQRRAMEAIIWNIARTGDVTYYPDSLGGERDSSFAQGMRFAGLQLLKLIEINPEFGNKEKENG